MHKTTKPADLLPELNKNKKPAPRKQSQRSTLRMNRNLDSLINREPRSELEDNESTNDVPPSVSTKEDGEEEANEEDISTDASGGGDEDEDDDSTAEELMQLLEMTKSSNELAASKKQLF